MTSQNEQHPQSGENEQQPQPDGAAASHALPAAAAAAAAVAADHAPDQPWAGTSLQELRARLQHFAAERDWGRYHTPRNLLLALTGEVGELAEIFQWKGDEECRTGLPAFSAAERQHVGEELSDVLLYLVRLADACGIDLPTAALSKMEANGRKYPADLARGSAAKYTQLAAQQTQQQAQQAQQQTQQQAQQAGQAAQREEQQPQQAEQQLSQQLAVQKEEQS